VSGSGVGPARNLIVYEVLVGTVFVALASAAGLSADQLTALWPLFGLCALSGAFWICLAKRDHKPPFFELGSFCMLGTVAYAAIPLVWYILSGAQFTPLSHLRLYSLDPTPAEFANVGWMYVTYVAALGAGYLGLRDRQPAPVRAGLIFSQSQFASLAFFFLVFQLFFGLLGALYGVRSNVAYDDSLYSSAAAYDQLPLAGRQVIDWARAAQTVVNCALATILASRWKKPLWRVVLLGWLVLLVVTYLISPGGRFLLLSMIISSLLAYDRFVRPIRLSRMFIAMGALFAAFVAAGLVRSGGSIVGGGARLIEKADDLKVVFTISNEFQISYGSALELEYLENHGLLESPPWQVYATEPLMLVPAQLLPFEKVDPVLWYVAASRDPDFFTYGVIAQSLLGLGWFEVIVRGLLVGVVLALVHNWWARSPANLWRNVFYIWLAVVSYYTVRGTSFYLATLVLLRFVPLVLAVQFFTWLLRCVAKARSPGPHAAIPDERVLQSMRSVCK
jgi:hypothetical protein